MRPGEEFFNIHNQDFLRVAVGIPAVRVADPAFNALRTIELMRRAVDLRVAIALFPELGLTAYSCEDLFQQRALLDAAMVALEQVVKASSSWPLVTVVGLPIQADQRIFNCAAVIADGRIVGVVPKTYLPNYREFYEARQFTSGDATIRPTLDIGDQRDVPFGSRLLFRLDDQPLCTFHVELCEDLWVPIPPSSHAALAGATVLLNLSASNITVAKADYRRQLVASQSARCLAAYLYSAAGPGESTTDLAWDGHAMIYENGNLLSESERFGDPPQLIRADIDLERLSQDRMRQTSFRDNVQHEQVSLGDFRTIPVEMALPRRERIALERTYDRFPYVPADPERRNERCAEVFRIQAQGLAKRLEYAGLDRVVIGVSGGTDSTHALLVCGQTMDQLGFPRANILAYTMPGFATSARTLEQARQLMRAVQCTADEIDIRPSCMQMFRDIGHPFAEGKPQYDITFENVQAGERTSHLFRLANRHGALVVGTGDLSELALGWCTYGVGDHMSHYSVNASIPKTLIRHLIRWVADTGQLGGDVSQTLQSILTTPVSPELIPTSDDVLEPAPASEVALGPYELQDFHLYYTLRFGYAPPKVAFLAHSAWHDAATGLWPDIPMDERHAYSIAEIKSHLETFVQRFFRLSQFKRSCVPNAPKVGSGGSLSPRGDYRAPSDSEATAWLAQLELIPAVD